MMSKNTIKGLIPKAISWCMKKLRHYYAEEAENLKLLRYHQCFRLISNIYGLQIVICQYSQFRKEDILMLRG